MLPKSKKPLVVQPDGSFDKKEWEKLSAAGPAARLGDKVQVTKISLDGDHLVLEINNGLKSGQHWYDHVEVGMGGGTRPVNNSNASATQGTYLQIDFHKPMEGLTAAEVKKILAPILNFDTRTATKLYSETLSPEMQKAIADKRALVGMDRDQVLLALGHPDHKYRESKDGVDMEDWIFGNAPGKVTFVTFTGSKVVKVKEQYAGLGADVR